MKARRIAIVVALLVGAALAWAWRWSERDAAEPAPAASRSMSAPLATLPAPQATGASAAIAARRPLDFEHWMLTQSSLRGADFDGAWDVDAQGRLHPTMALRRRFDQLLTLAGEATLDDITAYIGHDVRELAGADAAARVLDVWQRYLALQRYAFHTQADPQDRSTWGAALAERQQARRTLLGEEVAAAFYADEERQLAQLLSQPTAQGMQAMQAAAIDKATLADDARERLDREDAAWADWQRRLGAARGEIDTLRAAQQLSDLQKREAIDAVIARGFDAQEAVRVRALLHL